MRAALLLLFVSHAALAEPCFVVRDVATGAIVDEKSPALCKERLYPCSTFKVPLAVMGFDTGLLTDENTTFQWDGRRRFIDAWNRDATARTWLRDSVVWYSQRLTPLLGMARIARYLDRFRYGNRDFSGGIDHAWLDSTLKISAEEQLDFLIRLWNRKLGVSEEATRKTLGILPVAVDEPGLRVVGKTGSGSSTEDPKAGGPPFRVGWYVGYATRGGRTVAFAYVFTAAAKKGEQVFSGLEARERAVAALRALR